MKHIVDDLHENKVVQHDYNIQFVAVLAPEHGFRGEKQAELGDPTISYDNSTSLPVLSVYSMSEEEISREIYKRNITCIVVDVQDIGTRLYTFIWTMR